MTDKVSQMTKEELREMIESSVEQKWLELIGDPDKGLEIRKSLRNRFLRQKKAVARGDLGEAFEAVVRRLGLDRKSYTVSMLL
jgi:hypothetical protein